MLKIAVATSDGITIDVHFGQASSFHIFDVADDGTYQLLEQRDILPYSPEESQSGHPANATIRQLTDMDVILVNKIGDGPLKSLEGLGIRAYALGGSVDRALTAYGKRHKLFKFDKHLSPPQQGVAPSGCGGCSSHGSCGS